MTQARLAAPTGRPLAHAARRVVVKVGTAVLAGAGGAVGSARLRAFVAALVALQQAGREVLVVSSGAVRLGVQRLGLDRRPAEHAAARVCAAVVAEGQDPGIIGRVCGGEDVGTLFLPRPPAGRRDG